MATGDGGPAFARAAFAPHDVGYEDCGIHDSQEGLSTRDLFAGLIMAGLAASGASNSTDQGVAEMSRKAVRMANGLLAVTHQPEPKE